jgi:thiamine transport system permease protein
MNKQKLTTGIWREPGRFLYILVIVAFGLPVASVVGRAIINPDFTADWWQFVTSPVFRKTLTFSIDEAFWSAFFSLLVAWPGAYFLGKYHFPGERYLKSAMVLPFMLPGILVVLGMVAFYGKNGVLNSWLDRWAPLSGWSFDGLYGFWGIVMANVFYNFTFCLRILAESRERIDRRIVEAAATLGSQGWNAWRRIILPLLLPTLGYLFILVFLYSFLSFTVVLVLGGYLYKTLEVLIYIEYNHKLNFNLATVMVVAQAALLSLVLAVQNLFSRRLSAQAVFVAVKPGLNWRTNPWRLAGVVIYTSVAGAYFLGPLISILIRSFYRTGPPQVGKTITFINYARLFTADFQFAAGQSFGRVLVNSLGLALMVGTVTTGCAYWIARYRRHQRWGGGDFSLQLPVGISFVTFNFGLTMLGNGRLPAWLLIGWAQFFLAFPVVYGILRTAWREFEETTLEAAQILGASGRQLLRTVEFPLLRKSLGTAFSYGVAFSLGDLTSVLILGQGEIVTLPVALYRLIGHYHFAQATALGTVVIALSLVIYYFCIKSK